MKKNISELFEVQATNWLIPIKLKSLRVRLALWGLLLLGFIQIIASILQYSLVSIWLEEQVNNNLQLTAVQVSSVIYDPEEPHLPLDIADISLQLASNPNIAAQSFLSEQFFFVRLIDVADNVVLATTADYPIPIISVNSDTGYFDTINIVAFESEQDLHIRVYTLPLSYAPNLALQVGISLEQTIEIQQDVFNMLMILLILIGILAFLSGWFLADRALVPIRATAHTASEINVTDLSRRLNLASTEIELTHLAQTFNAMLDRLEQAWHYQRQFTADAAHELRTPLSIIQTGLEVTLSQERSANEYRSMLTNVNEEVQRLSQLANTLLILARTDSQAQHLDKQEIDISIMLGTVVDQFNVMADEKEITLILEIMPKLLLEGDEVRLIQVAYNVIDNAIKYTPANGQVRISAAIVQQQIEITIQDTGYGIPWDEQHRIFDRFYRTDVSRNRTQGGFGLGLAIAKHNVALHHGQIVVVSELEHGSQFTISLPIKQP